VVGPLGAGAVALLLVAATAPPAGVPPAAKPRVAGPHAAVAPESDTVARPGRMVRVALAVAVASASISATGDWELVDTTGAHVLRRGRGGEPWRVEGQGAGVRVAGDEADGTAWHPAAVVARPTRPDGFVRYRGRRYRGELWFLPSPEGITVVNRLPMEAYLRGVVPEELGTRAPGDRAALEAQAIAARSYATVRVPRDERTPRRGWHLRAGVADQVYGGVEAESPLADAAVEATAGLVLRYNGRMVTAPYSAACGGRTAAPGEAWDEAPEAPFLRPVDDHDPATGRAWCDIAPQGRWSRELDAAVLSEAVRRVLARVPHPTAPDGATWTPAAWVPVRDVRVATRGRSGRIGTLLVTTDQGEVPIRAAALRAWLLHSRSAALASTYFSVEEATRADGHVASIRVRGVGHGHGVGMCQWGAIGRARAGQDARTILQHYYPGTVVGQAD
jgi:stage II sporulation protein D